MKGPALAGMVWKEMQTKTLKAIARIGLYKHYGFAPAASEIHLLEADDFGNYIMIGIGDLNQHQYQIRRHQEVNQYPSMITSEYVYEVEEYVK